MVVNHYSQDKEHMFENILDRSWLDLEEYEEEMYSLANKDNTLMSLMCSVNLDLTDVVEDLSPAWANTLYDSSVLHLLSPGSLSRIW